MSHSNDHSHGSDQKAAFAGLIITTAVLALFSYGIVLWTNSLFAGKEHGAAPAGAAQEAPAH